MLSDASKKQFIRFVTEELTLAELESWIYAHTELESELGEGLYFDLASLEFQEKEGKWRLQCLIYHQILQPEDLREYEEASLITRLEDFIADRGDLKQQLDDFYALFCGHLFQHAAYWEATPYTFLQLLALRYLYWVDEEYLRQQHGDKWQAIYKEYQKEYPRIRAELVPIAQTILQGLRTKEIEILDGTRQYRITEDLKNKLEPS